MNSGQSFDIQWIQSSPHDGDIMVNGSGDDGTGNAVYLADDGHSATIDQIAAENLIFMARDGQVTDIIPTGTDANGAVIVAATDGTQIDCAAVMQQAGAGAGAGASGGSGVAGINVRGQREDDAGGGCYTDDSFADCTPQMVTEEVITDDWVQHQGEERVEIPAEQIMGSSSQVLLDMEVSLPTDQDEYTALRPYPCDFCSRRFRKKASLMNHMLAHKNDRPHLCKLCGSRFFRKADLIDHLKAHAEAEAEAPDPDNDACADFPTVVNLADHDAPQRRRHANDQYYDHAWGMQEEALGVNELKSIGRGKAQHNLAPTATTSATSTTTTTVQRGRISRLKPKEENYVIDECLQQSQDHRMHSSEMDYVDCSTAAVKLSQDHSPAHQKHYPIIDNCKPFVCQECGLSFSREKAMLSHSKNHRQESTYECNQCNEVFWDVASLQDHQKSHRFEDSNSEYDPAEGDDSDSESESEHIYGEYYCSECGMSFHRQDLLRRHSRVHSQEENTPAQLEEVAASGRHCCNTCGESFVEALDLLAHAEVHARYPPFKCILCGESFFEEHTIKLHLQSQHPREMTANSCVLCGKACRDRKALIKHAWDHSREKCHSCPKCGKNFHNKARLKRHMASHRDKSVVCDVCHEEFPDGRSLSNHRHSHSTASAGKLFPCHECGKTFGSRSSQQIHVRIHTGERPYGCRFCWKAFADGGTLRKHERIHTGEKPYACSVCPRAFNQRVVLREHIRSHHSGIDTKRGTYFCTVCSEDLPTSNELIQHLIKHSDMNTAMQRQPVSGPRKYKRRRKLKPHEIARLRSEYKRSNGNGNGSEIETCDFDMDSVDNLLGLADVTGAPAASKTAATRSRRKPATTATTSKSKRSQQTTNNKNNNNLRNNNNNTKTTAGGGDSDCESASDDDDNDVNNHNNNNNHHTISNSNGESDDDYDDDGAEDGGRADGDAEDEEEHVEVDDIPTLKKNINCPDKLWQTKLLNSNSSESLLSDWEHPFLGMDSLVAGTGTGTGSGTGTGTGSCDANGNATPTGKRGGRDTRKSKYKSEEGTSQRTQQVLKIKTEVNARPSAKGRKRGVDKTQPNANATRPRMIHTEKWLVANADGSRRRSKTLITRTDHPSLSLLPKSSLVSDYEIISPDVQLPNQISSSPVHIKQEHEQYQHPAHSLQDSARAAGTHGGDLYDAQMLLEAATLRKTAFEKYNPSVVNDLEEILRSPKKSDKLDGRQRQFTIETSPHFLTEEDRHFIKIEPTSPDLHDIVVAGSRDGSASGSGERRSTRATRHRLNAPNRKYLEFETDLSPRAIMALGGLEESPKRSSKRKAPKNQHKKDTSTASASVSALGSVLAPKSYLGYSAAGLTNVNSSRILSSSVDNVDQSSFSSIAAAVSAAEASAAAAAAVAPGAPPERKQRYFECEMCSAVFPDRSQLLDHVPIHI